MTVGFEAPVPSMLERLATWAPWLLLATGLGFVALNYYGRKSSRGATTFGGDPRLSWVAGLPALRMNALRPLRHPWLVFQSFIAGLAVREAAGHQIAWQVPIVIALVWLGALARWPGIVGIVLALAAWVGLVVLFLRAKRMRRRCGAAA